MRGVFLLLLILGLAGCSRGPRIMVINHSKSTISFVVAKGSGFSEQFGMIEPGNRREAVVEIRGESGLQLEFDANGRHFSSKPDGYFESGGWATATVQPDFTVTVETGPSQYRR